MRKLLAALSGALILLVAAAPAQGASQNGQVALISSAQAGICPNWSTQTGSNGLSGVKWSRSGSRKIYLEWSLSPTNLNGVPVSRRFTSDEAAQIRAAVSWWDSVFDSIEFREMSGDYAKIKIGAATGTIASKSNYWYYPRTMTFARGQIALETGAEAVYNSGRSFIDGQVRSALGYLLGLNSSSALGNSFEESLSRLRQIYGESSCYPERLRASWDTSNGLVLEDLSMVSVGSAQRIKLIYNGFSEIGASVLTPSVCRVASFSATAQTGFLVNITGQGVCTVLVQAREGSLPYSTEVLTLRTGFSHNILGVGVPKEIRRGNSFNLKTVTTSGMPVNLKSQTGSICRVTRTKVTALKTGTCRIAAWTVEATYGQIRFVPSSVTFSITVKK
jgi:hypothetical protein